MTTNNSHMSLMKVPGYQWEEYDAKAQVLSICVGELLFQTIDVLGRWTWLARISGSESWPKSKRRYGVVAASSVTYWRRGNAERSMRKFILSLAK